MYASLVSLYTGGVAVKENEHLRTLAADYYRSAARWPEAKLRKSNRAANFSHRVSSLSEPSQGALIPVLSGSNYTRYIRCVRRIGASVNQ
jgi:hypothetical protein